MQLTTESVPINDEVSEEYCNNTPCPKCPKCYSNTTERTIWDKFKPKKIIQCQVCKFYWAL